MSRSIPVIGLLFGVASLALSLRYCSNTGNSMLPLEDDRSATELDLVAGRFGTGQIDGPAKSQRTATSRHDSEQWSITVQRIFAGRTVPLQKGVVLLRKGEELLRVEVEHGIFDLPSVASEHEALFLVAVREGEKELRCRSGEVSVGGRVRAVRCYDYPGEFVEAVDEGGNPLDGLELRENDLGSTISYNSEPWHPGNLDLAPVLLQNEVSPLYIPHRDSWRTEFWIGHEGLTWARWLQGTADTLAAKRVTLRPAASLRVVIEGFRFSKGDYVEVMSAGQHVARHAHLDESVFVMKGLPPSACQVRLCQFQSASTPNVLDSSKRVELAAGEVTFVRLLQPPPISRSRRGQLSGTLTIQLPELWDDTEAFDRLRVVVSSNQAGGGGGVRGLPLDPLPLESMTQYGLPDSDLHYFWGDSELLEGEYVVEVEPLGVRQTVVVLAQESTAVDLVVPPVARTLVEFEGRDARVSTLLAIPSEPGGGHVLAGGLRGERGPGVYGEIVSLPGRIELMATGEAFGAVQGVFDVEGGWNNVTLSLPASIAVRFQVEAPGFDDLGSFSWWDIEFDALDGDGECLRRTATTSSLSFPGGTQSDLGTLYFSKPGKYSVTYPSLDGMRIEGPKEVDVREAQTGLKVLRLQKL